MGQQSMETIYSYRCNMTYMASLDTPEAIANYSTMYYNWYGLVNYEDGGSSDVKKNYLIACSQEGFAYVFQTIILIFSLLNEYIAENSADQLDGAINEAIN